MNVFKPVHSRKPVPKAKKVGKAYGFVDFRNSDVNKIEEVAERIPLIRIQESVLTPETVKIAVMMTEELLGVLTSKPKKERDTALKLVCERAMSEGWCLEMAFVLEYPGEGNRSAANVLGDFLYGVDREFFKEGAYYGLVYYERGGEYVRKRN